MGVGSVAKYLQDAEAEDAVSVNQEDRPAAAERA